MELSSHHRAEAAGQCLSPRGLGSKRGHQAPWVELLSLGTPQETTAPHPPGRNPEKRIRTWQARPYRVGKGHDEDEGSPALVLPPHRPRRRFSKSLVGPAQPLPSGRTAPYKEQQAEHRPAQGGHTISAPAVFSLTPLRATPGAELVSPSVSISSVPAPWAPCPGPSPSAPKHPLRTVLQIRRLPPRPPSC